MDGRFGRLSVSRLDQAKRDRLRTALGTRSETEALKRAVDLMLAEEETKTVLRRIKGKGRWAEEKTRPPEKEPRIAQVRRALRWGRDTPLA